MFEKTLTDVVKGIRASKRDTALYISQCIAEIKTEINSSDMYVKANALQKLTFLQMMGYGMSWASFATIEVMSSPRFAHKRIGYLAASQGFTQDTDVILLTTNTLKKELRGGAATGTSHNMTMGMSGVYEAGLAINCISNIVTTDLAQDLLPELTQLTSHHQPYLRKKAILCLFKVFCKYPQGLRLTFAQLQACLGDANSSVVSCAVNVITELSDKNPKNYLPLAPAFFDLLTTSSNNWMLIKVVKLLGSLVAEEPRLARKLLEPLADIVRNTPAKSLLYEAVHAITLCLPYCRKADGTMPASVPDIVTLCAKTLREFVEESDQNLKYLGLVGFGSLMVSHPKVLSGADYRPLILKCLSDDDVTIRTRALGLLSGMATRKNLAGLVTQLLNHVATATGTYKLDLVEQMIELCAGEKYSRLDNFVWYLDLLFQLGHMRGVETHAGLLKFQATEVALRVLPVRAYAVRRAMETLLERGGGGGTADNTTTGGYSFMDLNGDNGRGKHIMPEMLPGLAWIIGEYSDLIPEAVSMTVQNNNDTTTNDFATTVFIYDEHSEGPYHSIVQAVTCPTYSLSLPHSTQKVYIQAGMKVFAAATSNAQVSHAELEAMVTTLHINLAVFAQSTSVEVQERAVTSLALLHTLDLTSSLLSFLGGDMLPGLSKVKDESDGDDEDSSDDEDDEAGATAEGNLLEMTFTPGLSQAKSESAIKSSKKKGTAGKGSSSSNTSLAARCRDASLVLNYTLKPSPMKPASSKAQRKKHQTPPAALEGTLDLDAPVDFSIFNSLIAEEIAQRGTSKITMESISFTQQRPLRVIEHSVMDAISSGTDFSNMSGGGSSLFSMSGMGGGGGSGVGAAFSGGIGELSGGGAQSSFQRANMPEKSTSSLDQRSVMNDRPQSSSDPFYLNSGKPASVDAGNTSGSANKSRFGMIELGDAEDSEDDAQATLGGAGEDLVGGKKSKKEKKKHRKKSKAPAATASVSTMGGLGGGLSNMNPGMGAFTSGMAAVTVYDSDDEDEDNLLANPRQQRRGTARKATPSKEFSGLAMVDLTMPLREDEVMPERKHRVVPERSLGSAPPAIAAITASAAPSNKKDKKQKKESKRSKKAPAGVAATLSASTGAGVGDLLDLAGFSSIPDNASSSTSAAMPSSMAIAPGPVSHSIMSSQSNPINNAFDDLLGFSMAPSPAPLAFGGGFSGGLLSQQPSPSPGAKSGKRPWIRATIKTSNATGSPVVDWSKISLQFRVYRAGSDGNVAASISVRLGNHMEMSSLGGVTLKLKGFGDVSIGGGSTIGPGASAESTKFGPFAYSQTDTSLEIKGTLVTSDCSVPVKVSLPASMHLHPTEGLVLEDVAHQLSSSSAWSSHSAKLELSSGTVAPEKVKLLICNFLQAAEVEPGLSGPANGTYAAQSANGALVRVLVKIKAEAVKVDVKCTSAQLGKALVSDLKRLVL